MQRRTREPWCACFPKPIPDPAKLGNLVDMGKLAFAPATPEVLRLAHHLEATHELFGEFFHGVFRSVAGALPTQTCLAHTPLHCQCMLPS